MAWVKVAKMFILVPEKKLKKKQIGLVQCVSEKYLFKNPHESIAKPSDCAKTSHIKSQIIH